MSSPIPKADPAMFAPCPKPVSVMAPEGAAAMARGVKMRKSPAEWAFVRLSKLIEDFEKGIDKDEEVGARLVGLPGDGTMQNDPQPGSVSSWASWSRRPTRRTET